jgi:hypothetical protein
MWPFITPSQKKQLKKRRWIYLLLWFVKVLL